MKELGQAMKKMDDAVSRLPPQTRAQAQRDVASMRADVPVTTEEGQSTVAGRACRTLLTRQAGRLIRASCMADASAIELPEADRGTLVAVQAWNREVQAILAKGPAGQFATAFGELGLPLSTISVTKGVRHTSEFTTVIVGDLPVDVFSAPAGYKNVKFDLKNVVAR